MGYGATRWSSTSRRRRRTKCSRTRLVYYAPTPYPGTSASVAYLATGTSTHVALSWYWDDTVGHVLMCGYAAHRSNANAYTDLGVCCYQVMKAAEDEKKQLKVQIYPAIRHKEPQSQHKICARNAFFFCVWFVPQKKQRPVLTHARPPESCDLPTHVRCTDRAYLPALALQMQYRARENEVRAQFFERQEEMVDADKRNTEMSHRVAEMEERIMELEQHVKDVESGVFNLPQATAKIKEQKRELEALHNRLSTKTKDHNEALRKIEDLHEEVLLLRDRVRAFDKTLDKQLGADGSTYKGGL
eukprot:1502711-Rhodomonas_salina.1